MIAKSLTRRSSVFALGFLGVAGATRSAAAAGHPDAELLRLGAELERRWQIERAAYAAAHGMLTDEQANALTHHGGEIAGQIAAESATTVEGLRVKAIAWDWCTGGEYSDGTRDGPSEEDRLATGIFRDLMAMVPGRST